MTRYIRAFSAAFLILLSIILSTPGINVSASITCSSSQSPLFNICGPIQTANGLNLQSSIIQASDGTLRLAWSHFPLTGSPTIYYATRMTNGTWQTGTSITNLGGQNEFPSIVQLTNGTIFMFWSYNSTSLNHFRIYYRYLKGSTWSTYTALPLRNPTPSADNDEQPSAAVGRDGTLWLFWVRDNSTVSGNTPVMRQLWYETLNSTGWSKNEQAVTSSNDPNWNFGPSVLVGTDGAPRVVFARGQTSFQMNYMQRLGSGWTNPRSIVTSNSTANDQNPSLIQDRNGTLWLFWMRDMTTNLAIRAEYSWDNGQTWRGEAQLTSACSGCADSEYPAAVQSTTDKNLLVMFSTPSGTSFILDSLVTVNPISPVHHVAISNVLGSYSANASEIYGGGFHNPYAFISQSAIVLLSVTVQNLGDYVENVNVTMTATNTTSYPLGTQTVSVGFGGSTLVSFAWNTTGVRPARYGLSAIANIPVEPIGNQGDRTLAATNIVHLLPLGDVDQDGSVTLTDVSVVFYNYGFGCSAPGVCSSRYNPWADPSGLGTINILDVGIVTTNFDTFS